MKTTKLLLLTLALVCFVCMPLTAAAEGAVPEGLLGRIYARNNQTEILKNHHSFTYTEVGGVDDATYYSDGEVSIKDCREQHDYIRVRTPAFDYLHFKNDTFGRFINLESDACEWEGLPEEMLTEEVLSAEVQDGLLTVTTRPSEETRQYILEDEYADMADREKIQLRVVYVLDADTLELQSVTDYDTLPDGTEVRAWALTLAYDVEQPYAEEIDAVQAHLDAATETRTTTFIFDEGTAYEARFVYPTPVGDGCMIPQNISMDGIRYRIATERSTPTNEARDNEAILYFDRIAD